MRVRRCEKTGLTLVPAVGQRAWRLAKTSFGAMNPPLRESDVSPADWGRFDVADHRTMYCAAPACAAYAESLASLRPGLHKRKPQELAHAGRVLMSEEPLLARDVFDLDDGDETTLTELIEQEWAELNHMPPGSVPAAWRRDRLLHTLELPANGWFIDIETSDSVSALSQRLGVRLGELGLNALTVGTLKGEDREITTTIAAWLWHQRLDDGSQPHGIRYSSKHGSDWTCWAVWLRSVDEGSPVSSEPTWSDDGAEVLDRHHNPALDKAARLLGLCPH